MPSKRPPRGAEALSERMAGFVTPPTAAPAPRRQKAGRTAMPAEQARPRAFYSARISHTTTPEQKRALDLARVEDGIEATARLRAMTQLWIEDERVRTRVDKLARGMR